jgi:hypothetical protein
VIPSDAAAWQGLVHALEQEAAAMQDLHAALSAAGDAASPPTAASLEPLAVALAELGLLRALAVQAAAAAVGLPADVSLPRLLERAPRQWIQALSHAHAGLVAAVARLREVAMTNPRLAGLTRHATAEGLTALLGRTPRAAEAEPGQPAELHHIHPGAGPQRGR